MTSRAPIRSEPISSSEEQPRGVIALLRRMAPLAARAARWLRTVALLGLLSAVVLILLLWDAVRPSSAADRAAVVIVGALLLAPPAVLFLSYLALSEVIELPGRLRELPGIAGRHAAELARINEQLSRPGLRRFFAALLGLARLLPTVVSVRELLTIAPLVRLVSVPFLLATGGALLLCAGEAFAAAIALLWFLVARAL